MKTLKLLTASLLISSLLLSLAACSSGKGSDNTTTGSEKKTPSSASTEVNSDYDIEKVDNITVGLGTSEDDVKAQLPSTVNVIMSGTSNETSQTLFTDSFDSEDSFNQNWSVTGPEGILSFENGAITTTQKVNYFRAYLNEQDWMKTGTEEYANYVIKAVVKGHEETPSNNFGIIFRTTNVLQTGPDGYNGIYVGIGDPSGQVCIGCAQNNWTQIYTYPIGYVAEQDYTIEVVVWNDKFAVVLDGETIYEGSCTQNGISYTNGTVGIRTFEQLFSCSEFSVRTLEGSDYERFEGGYTYVEAHPVEWSCTDYDPNTKGRYGFIGRVTDLENAAIRVIVQVKDI